MRVDVSLVERGLCVSRQEAKELIIRGDVLIDGIPVTKPSKDISDDKKIEVLSSRKYVGRGGEKLEGAFYKQFLTREAITTFLDGKTALDVGSSTGGFTDFLLKHGIQKVVCVDVGSEQLHTTLRENPQVEVYENTDIRNFRPSIRYDVIVADLSFISLNKVLDSIINHGSGGAHFFLLFKPQFEVGKDNLKKGLVKDFSSIENIVNQYKEYLSTKGCQDITVVPCVITGGDGNQEYFITFTLPK